MTLYRPHIRPHPADAPARAALPEGCVEFESGLAPSRPIFIGPHILPALAPRVAAAGPDRAFVLCDETVFALHGKGVLAGLREHGLTADHVAVPRGEAGKTLHTLGALADDLLARHVTKDSVLLAVGGGATANLVGMVAALLFRGIRFVQVPTTLMAQTDGVISNKQAVNAGAGKNLLGTYYPPLFVWADTAVTRTEDAAHLRGALVESVKNGLISDPALLGQVDAHVDGVLEKDIRAIDAVAKLSVRAKLAILRQDPTERHAAMGLEYGHTFGHAIETLARGAVTHGHAVAIGMLLAARVSRRLGWLDAEAVDLHRRLLGDRLGLPLGLPPGVTPAALIEAMKADNKRRAGGVKFVLLKEIGHVANPQADCLTAVDPALIGDVLATA